MRVDLERGLYRAFRFNPCVGFHELRLRMRGTRAFWVLFLYAAVAAAIFLIAMWTIVWESSMRSGTVNQNLGRGVFSTICYTQLVLILLVLPAYSAGAITMEREKRTLDMLRATLLTASDVVSGKLLVVFGLGLLLLLTSLPIACWSLLLGGVAPEEVFYLYSYLLAVGAFAAALGMLYSALLGRSVGAVVATYGTLLAVVIVPLILMGVFLSLAAFRGSGVGLPLGDIWGAILLSALCLVCAWLLYLAFQWLWRRFLGTRLRFISYGLPAILLIIGLFQVLRPGSHALLQASSLQVYWLFLLEPFLGVVGILEGSNAISGIFSMMGARTSGINLQLFIWAGCTGAALLCAILCWALSIRAFRARG